MLQKSRLKGCVNNKKEEEIAKDTYLAYRQW